MSPKTRGVEIGEIERTCDALLILDVDEVVLEFIGPFQNLLEEHGVRLHFDSYKLTGNARSMSTGAALSAGDLDAVMQRLYAEQQERQPPANGVGEALLSLAEITDIVFLTAMDPDHYEVRRQTLDRAELRYPMIATERSKGGVVAELSQRWRGPIVFVDDLPPNLETVRKSVPGAHLVHLMAHGGFRPHLPQLPKGTHAAKNWQDAASIIRTILDADSVRAPYARPSTDVGPP